MEKYIPEIDLLDIPVILETQEEREQRMEKLTNAQSYDLKHFHSLELRVPRFYDLVEESHIMNQIQSFKSEAYSTLHKKQDTGMYYGESRKFFQNSFKGSSTNPVDVGLPATITSKSLAGLASLVESGVDYLKEQGSLSNQIYLIVGEEICKKEYSIGNVDLFKNKGCHISKILGNDIIICDKSVVNILMFRTYSLKKAPLISPRERNDLYGHSNSFTDTFIARSGVCSVLVSNSKKSLFYSNTFVK